MHQKKKVIIDDLVYPHKKTTKMSGAFWQHFLMTIIYKPVN